MCDLGAMLSANLVAPRWHLERRFACIRVIFRCDAGVVKGAVKGAIEVRFLMVPTKNISPTIDAITDEPNSICNTFKP